MVVEPLGLWLSTLLTCFSRLLFTKNPWSFSITTGLQSILAFALYSHVSQSINHKVLYSPSLCPLGPVFYIDRARQDGWYIIIYWIKHFYKHWVSPVKSHPFSLLLARMGYYYTVLYTESLTLLNPLPMRSKTFVKLNHRWWRQLWGKRI